MGGSARRVNLAISKPRSTSSKQKTKPTDSHSAIKQAAKKKHKKWSKDRAERVREDLDRDANLMLNALGKQATVPISGPQIDTVLTLTENMQTLGK